MTIETEIEYVESQLIIGHHIKDTFEEMQQQNRKLWQHWDQLLQHCEQLPQQRNQRQHAKAKQLRKQILQDMTAITQLNQSISSMKHTLRVLKNKMHIHSSTEVSLRTHPYNNFLLWNIIFYNQEHCFLLLFLGRKILKSMIKRIKFLMVKIPPMKGRPWRSIIYTPLFVNKERYIMCM